MIILEPKYTQQLINLLKKHPSPQPWNDKKILSALQDDLDQKEARKTCTHKYAKWKGKKECCVHCGGLDVGMGEKWETVEFIN